MNSPDPFGRTVLLHGTVSDITDPEALGRIRVSIQGFEQGADTTPWCHACSLLAGDGYGLYFLPVVGDEVIVARLFSADWIWLGFHWSKRKAPPADGEAEVRVLKLPTGQQIKFLANGDVVIEASGEIHLENDDFAVLTTRTPCQVTGNPHTFGSTKVKASD